MKQTKKINIPKLEILDLNQSNVTGRNILEADSISSWEKISFKNNRGILGQIIYPEDDKITLEKVTYTKNKLN